MSTHRRISPQLLISSLAASVVVAPITQAQASPYHHPLPSFIGGDLEDEGEAELDAGEETDVEADVEAEADSEVESDVDGDDPVEAEGPEEAPAPQPEPKKGLGMMITGAVITGVYALPVSIYGTSIIIATRRARMSDDGLEQLAGGVGGAFGGLILGFGIVGLAVGAPLLGVGASRFSRWRKWKADNNVALAPSVGRTAFGTYTPGITMRF